MKASAHLIDNDLKHKPDISAFLELHWPREPCMVEEVVAYEGEDEGEGGGGHDGNSEGNSNGNGNDNGEPVVTNVPTTGNIEIDPQILVGSQVQSKARQPRPLISKGKCIYANLSSMLIGVTIQPWVHWLRSPPLKLTQLLWLPI
ncbi:hypothetical protein RSOL_211930 [Rhizoctonia solani AG-3 Rhs1AP]|uniref:Uncharacterized protein n=2 Tax=Rhizoctonia solani AG-3 TaxID=1086053 RepID=A0A074RK87_9AGAM|nr:hypothetical protein RSOL_211930 [Rhizoctonia solani AG-3 Rhs1AP]KEP45740.1 hypothetical protein V565_245220 [Rhizoctonia solani 123E]